MSDYINRQDALRIFEYLERYVKHAKEEFMAAPDESSLADLKLSEATMQDIQLELIQRSQYNFFDGKQVVADLLEYRSLWISVLLARPGGSEISGMITLRDLNHNIWNADTLYILASDEGAAHRLAELGEIWQADNVIVHNMEATGRTLGTSSPVGPLVTMWWD